MSYKCDMVLCVVSYKSMFHFGNTSCSFRVRHLVVSYRISQSHMINIMYVLCRYFVRIYTFSSKQGKCRKGINYRSYHYLVINEECFNKFIGS